MVSLLVTLECRRLHKNDAHTTIQIARSRHRRHAAGISHKKCVSVKILDARTRWIPLATALPKQGAPLLFNGESETGIPLGKPGM
jgi:hypothetical protein